MGSWDIFCWIMYLFSDDAGVIALAAVWLGWVCESRTEEGKCAFGCTECAWHLSKTALLWAERNIKHPAASFSSGAWCLNAQAQSNSGLEARSPPPPQNPETTRLAQQVYTVKRALAPFAIILRNFVVKGVQDSSWQHIWCNIWNQNEPIFILSQLEWRLDPDEAEQRHGLWTWRRTLSAQVMADDPFW